MQVTFVLALEERGRRVVGLFADRLGRIEIANPLAGVKGRTLKRGRQKAIPPIVACCLRQPAQVGDGDERRQVGVFASQSVSCPSAHRRKAVDVVTRRHEILARAVRVGLAGERMQKAQLVGQFTEIGQQLAGHLPALPARTKFPQRLGQIAVLALECDQFVRPRHRLAVVLDQVRLVLERVYVAQRPAHEHHQHILRFGGEMRRAGGIRIRRVDLRTQWRLRVVAFFRGQQTVVGQQRSQRNPPQPAAGMGEESAAGEQIKSGSCEWLHDRRLRVLSQLGVV